MADISTVDDFTPLPTDMTPAQNAGPHVKTLEKEGPHLDTYMIVLIISGVLFLGSMAVWAYSQYIIH